MDVRPVPTEDEFEVLDRTASRRISRRMLMIVAGVVVLIAAGFGVHALLHDPPAVPITADGQTVADPDGVLRSAEGNFRAYVADHHGRLGSDPRCWFQRPAGSSDITGTLLCGPVQFYDSDSRTPYLRFLLVSHGTGAPLRLTPDAQPDSARLVAAPDGTKLLRPGTSADPLSTAGVSAPLPPPAAADTLTQTSVVHPAPSLRVPPTAIIGSDSITVRLEQSGQVDTYGSGADERSAPDGMRLFAFRFNLGGGENSATPDAGLRLGVAINSQPPAPLRLPVTGTTFDPLFVIVTPEAALVTLVLTEHGITQTLSLIDGTPGEHNIEYLQGVHRTEVLPVQIRAKVHGTVSGEPTSVAYLGLRSATRNFFLPHTGEHPSRTDHVFVTFAIDEEVSAGDNFARSGYRTATATFTPESGSALHPDPHTLRFDVPVDVDTGTLTFSGTERLSGGRFTFTYPVRFAVHLDPYAR